MGTIVERSAAVFTTINLAGAAYLIWLGVQAWRHAGEGGDQILETGRTRFVRGLLVALSNPKTIVFFTAFLPQFIDPKLPAGWHGVMATADNPGTRVVVHDPPEKKPKWAEE